MTRLKGGTPASLTAHSNTHIGSKDQKTPDAGVAGLTGIVLAGVQIINEGGSPVKNLRSVTQQDFAGLKAVTELQLTRLLQPIASQVQRGTVCDEQGPITVRHIPA